MQKAINIFGEQGTGKTIKAIEVAKKIGRFQKLQYMDPPEKTLAELAAGEMPNVLIIDAVPNSVKALNFIKNLQGNPSVPQLIVTSIKRIEDNGSRRFTFIEMN